MTTTEQPVDTRRVVRALRRRPLVLIGSVLAGMALAVGVFVLQAPRYKASALVLLPEQPTTANGQPARSIDTEIAIASSADVLTIAAQDLKPPPSVETLKREVHASGSAPDVLKVTASASSRAQAIAIANAAANAYRTYRTGNASNASSQLVGQLQHQASQLQTQITDLQGQIVAANAALAALPAGSRQTIAATETVDNLKGQQANVTTALSNLQAQIAQAQLNVDVNNAGTQVLEQATTATNNASATLARDLAIGGILGLLIAVVVIISRDSRDRRVRRRDDIARAVSVPALASLTASLPQSAEEWLEFIKEYEPNADERWGLHRALRLATAADGGAHVRLRIETLPEDEAAVAIAPAFAAFAASAGIRTVLVAVGNDASNALLQKACRIGAAARQPLRPNLWTSEHSSASETKRHRARLTVEAAVGGDPRPEQATAASFMTLFAVSAGVATPERLMNAALDASKPFAGVIVANPDADDPSPGRLADTSQSSSTIFSKVAPDAQQGSAS